MPSCLMVCLSASCGKKVNMPVLKLAGQESSFLSMSELSCSLLVSCDQVLKREIVLMTNLLIG